MSCDFAHHDGSYVLGALTPTERQEFELHLAQCSRCARSVQELAGLPGLLARVDRSVLDLPLVEDQVPHTPLSTLVREHRRTGRRRRLLAAGLSAAAAVTVAVASLGVSGSLPGQSAAQPSSTSRVVAGGRAMVPVGHAWVPARVHLGLQSRQWGTQLDVACAYTPRPGRYGTPRPAVYTLVVHTRDGRTEQVASWRSLPGSTMRLAASTATSRKDIASVEVHTADGRPVLRLAV